MHRIRGEILPKRGAVNTAPAEEAFLTAIAIAQQQKARSFELQQQFSKLVTKHEQLRAMHLEALRQADHLFQTLLNQAFSTQ